MATSEPIEQMIPDDQVALQRLHEAITSLPVEDIAEYLEAMRTSPALVESESNPLWFLRVVDYDIESAATRLAKYWQERKKSFGERAFLPITDLSGAGPLTKDDIAHLKSGAFATLGNDVSGKPVLGSDILQMTKLGSKAGVRLMFYLATVMSANAMAQIPGVVCVRFDGSERSTKVRVRGHPVSLAIMKTANRILPMKLHVFHMCVEAADPAARAMFKKNGAGLARIVTKELNCKVNFHVEESPQKMLEELIPNGLCSTGLPPTLGGTWRYSSEVKMHGEQHSVDIRQKEGRALSTRPGSFVDERERGPSKRLKVIDDGPALTNVEEDIKPNLASCLRALRDMRHERKCSIRDLVGHSTVRSGVFSLLKDANSLSAPQCKDQLELVLAGKEATVTSPPSVRGHPAVDLKEALRKAALRGKLLKLMISGAKESSKCAVAKAVSGQGASRGVGHLRAQQEDLRTTLISKVLERCRNSTPVSVD